MTRLIYFLGWWFALLALVGTVFFIVNHFIPELGGLCAFEHILLVVTIIVTGALAYIVEKIW